MKDYEVDEEEIKRIIEEFKTRKKTVEKEVVEEKPEKIEPKKLTLKVNKDLEFLRSCTSPKGYEKAIITDLTVKDIPIKYPVVIRDRKVPLEINYLVDGLMKATNGDFSTLKMAANSEMIRGAVLNRVCVEDDNEAKLFLEKYLDISNSPNSLKMHLGYELLAPRNVERVEETSKLEGNRRIMKVYTDLLGKRDFLLIGAGIAIARHINYGVKIDLVH